mmetsp:Transcript_39516/g.80937  ORF Transcript_39516/g.80937 Transcript_39516/m.80937 type:complete len:213 (+) Transcript_39516:88-726(+)|eukprot:CAMPEP_0181328162 /NCGR_PEP_ID=MMETSP1101-20121128/22538_1 /TAXON_ID=46948 /ORGANISM="Rhodomonas abbreviata, Strain Caron Lab Isolate" /LENGTH=212 /DNA_ID=CAMNT_0023436971 /DNA_START=87 /DNA_END=725 /DNA_ORIENTATION=+
MATVRYPKFVDPKEIDEVMFTEEQIQAKVKELGAKISEHYKGLTEPLIIICTLKGAATFFADLCRHLDIDCLWEFMSFSSYGMGATSSGAVQLVLDLKMDIAGRDVLVVEDILDTGNTLKYMLKQLNAREPKSVKTVCFLHKTEMTTPGVSCDFTGFEIPSKFVVGYGLDYAQKYRGMSFIGVLAPWVYTSGKLDERMDGSISTGDCRAPSA